MFEVKKEEYINKTFRMPVQLLKKLEALAQEEKVSLNNLIIQCCEYSLDNSKYFSQK
ncbi:MAG: toxin-antitoxin system HicB family antitoxin [Clostridia bacterium]|nr:toxin-antitoxin system HicB family antitoxin [Clostridia bacterium]